VYLKYRTKIRMKLLFYPDFLMNLKSWMVLYSEDAYILQPEVMIVIWFRYQNHILSTRLLKSVTH
jgi:hypothetical protein